MARNLIKDATKEELLFWDVLSRMIRQENKKSYHIDEVVLLQNGFDEAGVIKLFQLLSNNRLKGVICFEDEMDLYIATLIGSLTKKHNDEVLEFDISPSPAMRRLVDANYDFIKGETENNGSKIVERIGLLQDSSIDITHQV